MNEAKDFLRKQIQEISRLRTDARASSAELTRRLRGWTAWESAVRICAFCALGDEPEILALWPEGKRVALPRVAGDELSVHWVACREELVPGKFGILEPRADAPSAGRAFDLILVPGMAFDRTGGRLGRGKGYYDRFLTSASGFVAGVCFDDQLVSEVPREPHDARIDAVVTPSSISLCDP
jgi:5-formyltetrahydrofolate cyclo-ligase